MKNFCTPLTLLIILVSQTGFSQNEKASWYANLSVNRYTASNLIKDGANRFGIGLGASVVKPVKENLFLKHQGNVSFNTYSDHIITFTDPNGIPIVDSAPSTIDFVVGLSSTINYSLAKDFSIGTGLGFRTLLSSKSTYTPIYSNGTSTQLETVNSYYKPIMPVVPIEMSLKINKVLLNLRYEYSILNKIRGDLSDYVTQRYGIVSVEVGYKIR
jgi:hypothetical protein